MVNAAVAVGQQTCKEDAMWKKIFDEDSETTPVMDQPSKSDPRDGAVLGSNSFECFWTIVTHCL